MIPLDSAWNLYLATRIHYMSGYDAVKYKGKLKASQKRQERPDKILAMSSLTDFDDKRDLVEFCAANFLHENDGFLYASQDDAMTFYRDWKKYWDSIDYFLEADISSIEISMHKSKKFLCGYIENGLYEDVLMNKVTRETLCVIAHQLPAEFEAMQGFGADRLKNRVKKTLPLIKNRLESTNINIMKELDYDLMPTSIRHPDQHI